MSIFNKYFLLILESVHCGATEKIITTTTKIISFLMLGTEYIESFVCVCFFYFNFVHFE